MFIFTFPKKIEETHGKEIKFNLRNLPQSPRQRAKFQSMCIYFRLKQGAVYIVYSFLQLLYCAFIIAHIKRFVKRLFYLL